MSQKNGMPTRGRAGKSGQRQQFGDTTWVKCELTDGQKSELRARGLPERELLEAVEAVVAEGFKLSLSYDERSDCMGAYLTAPKDLFPGRSVCLSARAPDMAKAIAVLLYKHHEIMRGDWTDYLEAGGGKSDW